MEKTMTLDQIASLGAQFVCGGIDINGRTVGTLTPDGFTLTTDGREYLESLTESTPMESAPEPQPARKPARKPKAETAREAAVETDTPDLTAAQDE